jgi:hypothetical protein
MKSNKMFKKSKEWWKNAIVDNSDGTKASYSLGYKKAGDILADKVLKDGFMIDAIFLPMCYCYRHFIELSLKDSISELTRLINRGRYTDIPEEIKREPGKLTSTHSLDELWEMLEERIDIAIEPRDKNWDDRIKGYIHEFHIIDKNSQAFRYPLDTNGAAHFKKEGCYGIEMIKLCMEEIEAYFYGLDGYIGEQVQFNPEEGE